MYWVNHSLFPLSLSISSFSFHFPILSPFPLHFLILYPLSHSPAGTSYVNLTFAKFVISEKYCIVALLPMSRYYLDTLFILFEQVSSESKCCRGQSWVENHPPHLLWPQVLNLGLEWNHLFHPMPNVYNFPGGLCFVPVYCNRPLGLVMMTKNSFECNCHLKFLNPLICQPY